MPQYGKGANSGLRFVASDSDAALPVPGSGGAKQTGAAGGSLAPAMRNAELSGKLFAVHLGECSKDPGAAALVSEDACLYSVRYEMESGLKRRASRSSGPPTRASLFSGDWLQMGTSPERFLY